MLVTALHCFTYNKWPIIKLQYIAYVNFDSGIVPAQMTCSFFHPASRCEDPGTPGGMRQIVTSYESGQTLSYQCKRPGFTLDGGPANRMCITTGPVTDWDNGDVVTCIGM